MLIRIILIAFLAGVLGSVVGGVLGLIVKRPSKFYISNMLGFAAGAMIGVSVFELIPESYEYGSLFTVVIGVILGVLFILGLNLLNRNNQPQDLYSLEDNKNILSGDEISENEKKALNRIGIAIFISMALHSLPEGFAIGAGEYLGIGLLLGIVFFLHFIPEGMAIAVPLKAGGTKHSKIILLCFLAGLPVVVGGIIVYFLSSFEFLLPYTLSFASGAMLYTVMADMLPTAYSYTKKNKILTMIIILGMISMFILQHLIH